MFEVNFVYNLKKMAKTNGSTSNATGANATVPLGGLVTGSSASGGAGSGQRQGNSNSKFHALNRPLQSEKIKLNLEIWGP